MKFIATHRIDNLLQSAVDQVGHTHNIPSYITDKAKNTLNYHINNNNVEAQSYLDINDKASIYLRKWAKAISQKKLQQASSCEQQLDLLADGDEFPWQATKKIFLSTFKKPHSWIYRDWQKQIPKDINFGTIEYKIPSNAKIAIFGDWGTGTPDSMVLLNQLLAQQPDIILHTGDIYYAGTSLEVENNFIKPLELGFKKMGRRIPVFSIPGNHDYYAGGQPFYDMIEVINQSFGDRYQQKASYFCLRTVDDSWQILGSDTAINDSESYKKFVSSPGVTPSEFLWHKDKLQFNGKTLFLSHHPLIDVENKLNNSEGNLCFFNKKLLTQFGSEFMNINLWIWGHNHYFIPFVPKMKVPSKSLIIPKSRLIGGSARETSSININYPKAIQTDIDGKILPNSNNNLINHTWCLIDLGTHKIRYYQGAAWHTNSLHRTTLGLGQKAMFFEEKI